MLAALGPAGRAWADAPPCQTDPIEVHAILGWLHPCGSFLGDARGRLVRPLAVSLWDMARDVGRDPALCRPWQAPPRYEAARLRQWKFTAVLLYVSWANVEPRPPSYRHGVPVHHYDESYLLALDRVVRRFAGQGIKVILDMTNDRWSSAFTNMDLPNGIHVACGSGMPAWLYPKGGGLEQMVQAEREFFSRDPRSKQEQRWFAKAWRAVAGRYRGNRTVIGAVPLHEAYDLLAQPYPGAEGLQPGDLHLALFYEHVGAVIAAANRRLLLLTPDRLDWNTGKFAMTRPPRLPNAVLTFEFFAPNWNTSGHPRMDAYMARAAEWQRPAWVEEYFAFLPTSSNQKLSPKWAQNAAAFQAYARDHRVGWSYAPYSRLPQHPPGLLEVLQGGF